MPPPKNSDTFTPPVPQAQPGEARAGARLRSTQSMIATVGQCARKPSLLGMEIAWRWVAGIPSLWLILREWQRIYSTTSLDQTGISQFSLLDQTHSTYSVLRCVELLWPPIVATVMWLGPLLLAMYAVASGIGRWLVISRAGDASFKGRWRLRYLPAIVLLQACRVAGLAATLLVWIAGARWIGGREIVQPLHAAAPDPNIVAFLGALLTLTVVLMTLWAAASYVFNAAQVLVMGEGRGFLAALGGAFRMGWLRGKLIEINLSLSINKLALMVLAVVFCSTPMPFETVMTGQSLYSWWLFVLVIYCIASDLFHVVRSVAYIELWKAWRDSRTA